MLLSHSHSRPPAITIDNATAAMHLRASPQTGGSFPVVVCDALLPPGTVSAVIEGRPLPVPKPSLGAIAVLGDTGCRLEPISRRPGRTTAITRMPVSSRIATGNQSGRLAGEQSDHRAQA
jgi:hypothetical protein